MTERIKTYSDFWPFYLSQHTLYLTKLFHLIGVALALPFTLWCVVTCHWAYILFAPCIGYGFAWYSHFFIEKNKPATFTYPFWSFISDFRMAFQFIQGKL